MERIKLSKRALNYFIVWSTSRYNNYCGFGTKKENIDLVFQSLLNGCYTKWNGQRDATKTTFIIECAGGVGENGNGRYWKLKGRVKRANDYSWEIDCLTATVKGLQSNATISFDIPNRSNPIQDKNLENVPPSQEPKTTGA